MGCGSCSSGGCSPAGCGNKGSCASGGCNRLNVFDWLSDVDLPWGQREFDIVEVHFKGTRKEFFRNSDALDLFPGDWVVVEGSSGHDVGKVSLKGELVRLQLKRKKIAEDSPNIRKLYRKANEQDVEKLLELRAKEPEVMAKSRNIIRSMKLDMKLGDVEFQADRSRIIFYYTAEERVDFRELIRHLADEFKVRVEMKQIGARQEAGRIGGLGVCGLELCCSSWLSDFKTVSTSAARYQNLSLNPAKLAGQCGRLKCCLNYELDTYIDAQKDFPNDARILQTAEGNYELIKTDIFKKQMWYQKQQPKGAPFNTEIVPFALTPEKVKEVKELNKKGQKPATIEELIEQLEEELELVELDFESVAEGGLDRFDREGRRRKKKKRNNNQRPERTFTTPTKQEASSSGAEGSVSNQRPESAQFQQNRGQRPNQHGQPRDDQRNRGPRPQGNRPNNSAPGGAREERSSPQPANVRPREVGGQPKNDDSANPPPRQDQGARAEGERPTGEARRENNPNNRNRNNRRRPNRPRPDKPGGEA